MQPNQKLKDKNGVEICLYPLPVMNITQVSSPDSYSHCCGHPIDAVGTSAKANLYAPVTMKLIRIYQDGNGRLWQSQREVITPSGKSYVCIYFVHDDNPPYSTLGSTVAQGDLIAHTGVSGYVTGDHTHIDQAKGENKILVNYGITCSSGNICWALQDSVNANEIFYVNDTEIINDQGLLFETYKGGSSGDKKKFKYIYYLSRKRRLF